MIYVLTDFIYLFSQHLVATYIAQADFKFIKLHLPSFPIATVMSVSHHAWLLGSTSLSKVFVDFLSPIQWKYVLL